MKQLESFNHNKNTYFTINPLFKTIKPLILIQQISESSTENVKESVEMEQLYHKTNRRVMEIQERLQSMENCHDNSSFEALNKQTSADVNDILADLEHLDNHVAREMGPRKVILENWEKSLGGLVIFCWLLVLILLYYFGIYIFWNIKIFVFLKLLTTPTTPR